MANKVIDFGYSPSEYQKKIFDFVQYGVGNAVIKACAGSGKTSTAVAAMKLIPKNKKCLFIAFNKSIVEELERRLVGYDNVSVRTAHSLGRLMVRRNLGNDIEIDEYKYRTYLKNHINELTTINVDETPMTRQMVEDYINSISMLIDYSRFNIAQTVDEISKVADKYDIPVSFDECHVALKCLEWGKANYKTIDYTDMIWLPYELSLRPSGLQYDWVIVDECQDMSLLTIQLFLKCFKRGSRFMCIGDNFQAIYAFSGASEEAFEYMQNYPNTTNLTLPITYRCAKSITRFANILVPDMKSREGAPEGSVVRNCHIDEIREGDMVLARSRTPLLKLYTKLLRRGVNCYVKGKDIGTNLIKMLEEIDGEELNSDLNKDGVFVRLYEKMFNERNKLMEKRGLDLNDATLSVGVMNMYDSISSLNTLAEKCNTKSELISRINDIFQDEKNGVCLSTIHKAKGLESDNVYILCHSMMPSKLAKRDWEKIQEKNIQYVAYTRAKNKLGFISEKEIPPSGSMLEPTSILTELRFIENKICKILGKQPAEQMTSIEISRMNLRNVTQVDNLHESNKIDITEKVEDENEDTELLGELIEYLKRDSNAIIKVEKVLSEAKKSRD